MTQKEIILKHLRDYGAITPWEAIQNYGIIRLAAVILLLKREGFNITDVWVYSKNRNGGKSKYKKYALKED